MPVRPQLSYPGVYVQEVSGGPGPIAGVPTSITAFIGRAKRGPVNEPITINDAGAFGRHFGGLGFDFPMSYAVRDFFQAGGSQAVIVRLFNGGQPAALTVRAASPWVARVHDTFRDGIAQAFKDPESLDDVEGEFRDIAAQFDERPLQAGVAGDLLEAVLKVIDDQNGTFPGDAEVVTALRDKLKVAIAAPGETRLTKSQKKGFESAIDAEAASGVAAVVAALRAATEVRDVSALKGQVAAVFTGAANVDDAMLASARSLLADSADEVKAHFEAQLSTFTTATTVADATTAINGLGDTVTAPIDADARDAVANVVERGLEAAPPAAGSLAADAKALVPAGYLAKAPALFTIEAANEGAWANQLHAWVDHDGIGPDTEARYASDGLKAKQLFNLHLALVDARGQVIERETHNSVTTLPGTSRTLGLVLKNGSALARSTHTDDKGTPPPDSAGGWVETDVDDGAYLKIKHYASLEAGEGFNAFDKTDLINLMCVPPDQRNQSDFGGDTHTAVYAAAVAYARKRRAFLIVDGPAAWDQRAQQGKISEISPNDVKISGELARYAAVYFPRVKMADPEKGDTIHTFPVSGLIAGLYSRTDATRGVWKAPAGIKVGVNGIDSLTHKLTDAQNGQLNPLGVNCIRTFPVTGTVVWGARTLAGADQKADEYKYIPVRRTALFIAESLYRGTQWAVFEPNDEPLWSQLRLQVGAFMNGLFRQGAFQGSAAKDAYFVRCDATTTTQNDIDLGIVNVVVGFAPLKPAEFVVIYIQQKAGANQ